jgi:hypothetical protein
LEYFPDGKVAGEQRNTAMQTIQPCQVQSLVQRRRRHVALLWAVVFILTLMDAPAATLPARAADNTSAAPAPIVLYDGSKGDMPEDQGFTFQALPSVPRTVSDGATILDTSSSKNIHAGYFSKSLPDLVLDRAVGYTVGFTVQVELEDHSGSDKNGDGTADRSGFSAIVLSSDKRGIELGFWKDQIWAQNDGTAEPPAGTLFTHGEGAAFNTTGLIGFQLTISSDTYRLSSGGVPILSGSLRDYTGFTGFPDPYETPNMIFLGDDTGSASAKIRLAYVAVTKASPSLPSLQPAVYVPLVAQPA